MDSRIQYADIIVDISHESVDRTFQYRIPEMLLGRIEPGMSVSIPFGRGNTIRSGYVIELSDKAKFPPDRIKELAGILEESVSVEANLIRLAGFLKKQYGSTMITALKTVLPVKQKVKSQNKRSLILVMERQKALLCLEEMKRKRQSARARLLEELLKEEKLPYEIAAGKLNITAKTIKELETKGYLRIQTESQYRIPIHTKYDKKEKKVLSKNQQYIIEEIRSQLQEGKSHTYLIHGITGSGKTEVYMELIAGVIEEGKQAIVLIPEIALTYQTVLRFVERFGERVSIMNSKLSYGEKYDQCERARKGEIDVIIGPRSALFTPFPKLGLIIIDEEHEGSYKSESMPKYHAREVAQEIAGYHQASVVLGSATPAIESYYKAKTGEYRLFTLQERLAGGALPTVYTVDLREELKEGNRTIFSRKLMELTARRLKDREQVMLFLNRRGYAGFVSCRSCGYVMKCPHCDVSLSEHLGGKLICHYCGYTIQQVTKCPQCGSPYILGFKAGTQQIVEQLAKYFPEARVLRMDADTTKSKDSYEKILSDFANQNADILVGTQMIVKGHDFPNVTLVGILAADLSLHSNDYRAGERTFQLLTQAAGRAGRGKKAGEVVIQTYQPEHYSVTYAAAQDYAGFYEQELIYRELAGYPPAVHMLAVMAASTDGERAEAVAGKMAQKAKAFIKSVSGAVQGADKSYVIGPAPATVSKVKDIYRFVFYVKHREYAALVQVKDVLELYMEEMDYKKENIQFDFNPMNTY